MFGSVFFSALKSGNAANAYRNTVIVQACLLVVFLAVTVLFPLRARPEGEPTDAPEPETENTIPVEAIA